MGMRGSASEVHFRARTHLKVARILPTTVKTRTTAALWDRYPIGFRCWTPGAATIVKEKALAKLTETTERNQDRDHPEETPGMLLKASDFPVQNETGTHRPGFPCV